MIELGVIDEVRQVFKNKTPSTETKAAFKAIGVNEIKYFIDNKIDFKNLEQSVITKTCQYAKRQRTWFRAKFKSWNSAELSAGRSFKTLTKEIEKNYL